jgi:DNA-binding FadR family transcriptional regulator
MARFGSDRTSVRETLRMIEQSGLITIKQGIEGGAFVTDVNTSRYLYLRPHVGFD